MSNSVNQVAFITGASSGIGNGLREYFFKEGYKVYGTSRNADNEAADYKVGASGNFIKMINLDVCSDESVQSAVDYVIKKEGTIDVLINNAGYGIAGSVEDTTVEDAYNQLNTNFFGTLRVCRAVLPIMREHKSGTIVNISSVAGLISIPYQSLYSVSKYGIEALTEALKIEVRPFGVKVSMVEPGDTKTGFTDKRVFTENSDKSAYKDTFLKSIKTMEKDERNGVSPEDVVRVVAKVVKMKNPPVRTIVGLQYQAIVFLKRILPTRFFQFIISKVYA
jgi:short-subunit dehydrogenase